MIVRRVDKIDFGPARTEYGPERNLFKGVRLSDDSAVVRTRAMMLAIARAFPDVAWAWRADDAPALDSSKPDKDAS